MRALEANQPALHEDVRLLLDDPRPPPDHRASTTDDDHPPDRDRCAAVLHDVAWLAESHASCGLSAVGKVTAARTQDAPSAPRYPAARKRHRRA